jgi:hypothetical protein
MKYQKLTYGTLIIILISLSNLNVYTKYAVAIKLSFSENILISTSNSPYPHHVEPMLAISDNGTLFVGWKNANGHNTGGVRVSFSKSVDGGRSWTLPFDMPLFTNGTGQSDPWLVWFNGTLYYSYIEFSIPDTSIFSQVTLAKSTDYGKTWSIVKASQNINFADKETMTITSNGTILIAYADCPTLTSNVIRLSISTDEGQSFSDNLIISDNDGTFDQIGPYIATDKQDNIYVSWIKFTSEAFTGYIAFDKLDSSGFGIDTAVTSANHSGLVNYKGSLPILHFDSKNRLYLLWSDFSESGGSWDVYIKYSEDFGLTWSNKIQVNPNIPGNQWMADMDLDTNDNLHIVYYNEIGSHFRPFYQSITINNGNLDISKAIAVADKNTSSLFNRPGDYLTVQIDSDFKVHVVWSDGRNEDMDIYYANCLCLESENSQNSNISLEIGFFFGAIFVIGLYVSKKRKRQG